METCDGFGDEMMMGMVGDETTIGMVWDFGFSQWGRQELTDRWKEETLAKL